MKFPIKIFVICVIMQPILLGGTNMDVRAAIGAIGSPVVPSNKQAADKSAKSDKAKGKVASSKNGETTSKKDEEPTPILVIEFDQKRVYFNKQLKQAISGSESSKAGITYEVVSRIPSEIGGKLQIEHSNDDYNANLSGVLSAMQDLGVPLSRIQSRTEANDGVASQQIMIIVKQDNPDTGKPEE